MAKKLPIFVERKCSIVDVPIIVRVNHGHLDKAYRVEHSSESREKFSVTATVSWQEEKVEGFDQLFNYATLYKILQNMHDFEIKDPIESFLDEIEKRLIESAVEQKISVSSTYIKIVRPDLLHGHVMLEKKADYIN